MSPRRLRTQRGEVSTTEAWAAPMAFAERQGHHTDVIARKVPARLEQTGAAAGGEVPT